MPTYDLTENSSNYSETTRRLWFYSKLTDFNNNIKNSDDFKCFKYKAKLSAQSK